MQKPWSVPANREVANKYFKFLRAHEEIYRLNIEVRRLNAWITHEDQVIKSAIDTTTDLHLAAELRHRYAERQRVNNLHRIRILAIYCLEGYSGPGPFVPEVNTDGNHIGSDEELIDDDDLEDEVLRLGEFSDSLTLI